MLNINTHTYILSPHTHTYACTHTCTQTQQSLIEVGVALICSSEFAHNSCPWMAGWCNSDSKRQIPARAKHGYSSMENYNQKYMR
jgi:hypothetical protein